MGGVWLNFVHDFFQFRVALRLVSAHEIFCWFSMWHLVDFMLKFSGLNWLDGTESSGFDFVGSGWAA